MCGPYVDLGFYTSQSLIYLLEYYLFFVCVFLLCWAKLERIPLLNSLEANDLQKIACSMTECSYDPNDFLMREGEAGTEFFIILSVTIFLIKIWMK